MAYVTRIGPSDAQVEYRLVESAGCGAAPESPPTDRPMEYRTQGERPLRWIGAGCADYGVVEGATFTDDDLDRARHLMNGVDWRTGERLVPLKVEAAPAAKLPLGPLLDAVLLEASRREVEPEFLFESARQAATFGRLVRGVQTRGDLYTLHVDDVGRLADSAGVDVLAVYGTAFTDALAHREDRIDVRNRGYDLALTLPKSFSVLLAYAPAELARQLERDVFDAAAHDTLRYVESVAAYGMRGHHGDGRSAARIEAPGFVGWSLVHRSSRAGDPHHHVHLTVANMVRGEDGKWSAVASGGRDLMRHTHAAGAFMEARTRHLLHTRFGIATARNDRTGQWEIVGIPDETLRLFSKRDREIRDFLAKLGVDWNDSADGMKRTARDATRDAKDAEQTAATDDELRTRWRCEGRRHGDDPDRVMSVVRATAPAIKEADLERLAADLFDPKAGITAHRKSFDRAEAFAAILERLCDGVPDVATADRIVDAVLQRSPQVLALPARGPRHMSDVDRYTTVDIVTAEHAILSAARYRRYEFAAVVPDTVAAATLGAFEALKGHVFADEQRVAFLRLVAGGHGIDAVIGVAGSGKTTLMTAARMAWEAAGYTVGGASTAAVAAQNLTAETGIPSRTVAALLHDQRPLPDVLVVDEAAMVDDRDMARLVEAAGLCGTKLVGIGDPKQLRAAGVGGSFAHVHAAVEGPTLHGNRRQAHAADRHAVALVRAGQHLPALGAWSELGRVHVADTREDALAAMLSTWSAHRHDHPDPLRQMRELLMIAYTNADVDALNLGARALRRAAGELGEDRTYRQAHGERLNLAVGDVVRVRHNLWSRTDPLLNGHRGIVVALREDGAAVVASCSAGTNVAREALVAADDIAHGALTHGYAVTDHAAQGQTVDTALVYPIGMDANAFYPAVTRHRHGLHLFVPFDRLEDDLTRARLGPVRDDADRQARAVAALARGIATTTEEMVTLQPPSASRRRSGRPGQDVAPQPGAGAVPGDGEPPTETQNRPARRRRDAEATRAGRRVRRRSDRPGHDRGGPAPSL